MFFARFRGDDNSGKRRLLLIAFVLFLFAGVLVWLTTGTTGQQGKAEAQGARAPVSTETPATNNTPADGQLSETEVVTERPKDDEFKAVEEVMVDKTNLRIGDPFDYISHLFKSVNRLGKADIASDPALPGSIVVTHVYVNYDKTILKVQAKRKTRLGLFVICGLWTAPPRK
jgi:hypothetical protein